MRPICDGLAVRITSAQRWPLLLACATMACASTPVARRATLISDADVAAKAAVAREASLDPSKIPPRTFAIVPFNVAATDTLLQPLSYGLADLLLNDLAMSPMLRLVERVQTDAILRELDLVDQGIADPRQAPRVGRLVGARQILIGDAARGNAGAVRLSARVVDVIGGTVQDLVHAEAPLDRVIDAEKALALLLFERLGIQLTPAQRQRIEQRQTTQLAALVAYGRGVQAEARGDATGATAAFEDAARLDAAFTAARTQAAAAPASSAQRANSVARVLDLAAQAVNAPVATRVAEAVDAPLAASSLLQILITVRVTP
ncbi:MAG: CsgG/HfaB family protein [Gemmatimonadaceae bacterium]|nr:CsgG/HfaB family protein [Gemmatimonadaceae bacterium]